MGFSHPKKKPVRAARFRFWRDLKPPFQVVQAIYNTWLRPLETDWVDTFRRNQSFAVYINLTSEKLGFRASRSAKSLPAFCSFVCSYCTCSWGGAH